MSAGIKREIDRDKKAGEK